MFECIWVTRNTLALQLPSAYCREKNNNCFVRQLCRQHQETPEKRVNSLGYRYTEYTHS